MNREPADGHLISAQDRLGEAFSATRLSIVIPAFNEELGIGDTLRELQEAVPEAEIIVIDDGSTDGTAEVVRQFPSVNLMTHGRNRGYGASLKTGARRCHRQYIAWYDADGQHRPVDLIAVARLAQEKQQDMVIGVRGAGSAKQMDRTVGRPLIYAVARLISREPIYDLNSGLRCFRRSMLMPYLHLLPDGFSASTTSTLLMLKLGRRVGYSPIVVKARVGKSTVKLFRDGIRTLQLIVRIVVLFEAFPVFTALGMSLLVPGVIYGFVVAMLRGQGFPTLAGIAVIAGLLTFFMGIIADQVVELRKERFHNVDFDDLPGSPQD
jgi:glycosyltransferase involved in cell wall biosynthesis